MEGKVITVNGNDYRVVQILGRGGSAKVYDCLDKRNNFWAIKVTDLEGLPKPTKDMFINELKMFNKLKNCPCIIKVKESQTSDTKLTIVMERGDTDLEKLFTKIIKRQRWVDRIMRQFYWQEMLTAVKELHQNAIVHGDLKPANFVLVAGSLKLIDLGIAKSMPDKDTSLEVTNSQGTVDYMSPERIAHGGNPADMSTMTRKKIGYKSDIWSLGCILYSMVYGNTPFAETAFHEKMAAIVNPKNELIFPQVDPKDAHIFDVLEKCLQRDPKKRPSIDELLAHPYLCPVDPALLQKLSKQIEGTKGKGKKK